MPQIVDSDTPSNVNSSGKPIVDFINKNHINSTKIGENQHHLKYNDNTNVYYHYINDKPNELSFISKNIQVGVTKGVNGDVTHIHNFMRHHINSHGELHSSNSNTNGSKNLCGDKLHIDHSNIDSLSNKIWGKGDNFTNITISARK
jgi:hypothetical protein